MILINTPNLRTQLIESKRLGKITVKDSSCGYIDIREKGGKKDY